MKFFYFIVSSLVIFNLEGYILQDGYTNPPNNIPLLNNQKLQVLCKDAPWADSHGSDKQEFLGGGLLYYSFVYSKKAKLSVCLGSGGGFVPRIMRQAQRDLNLEDSLTILIDGDIEGWGTPKWMDKNSFFRKNYPDIKIIIERTDVASKILKEYPKIDYLHIDADHSFEGVKTDFYNYLPLMAKDGVITIHDTGVKSSLGCKYIVKHLRKRGYNVVNFYNLGCGFALIQLGD